MDDLKNNKKYNEEMKCEKFHSIIPSYLEKKCKPEDAERVSSHLSSCNRCASIVDEVKITLDAMHSPAPEVSFELFYNKIESKISKNGAAAELVPLPRISRAAAIISVAAAIAFGIFIGNSLMRFQPSDLVFISETESIIDELSLTDMNTPSSSYYELFNNE